MMKTARRSPVRVEQLDVSTINDAFITRWLLETDEGQLARLFAAADRVRRENVGDEVHLRGLLEISNRCVRQCTYCGLRHDRRELPRYRMNEQEVIACAHEAVKLGYGTVVLQAGEDYGLTRETVSRFIRAIKSETHLAVTLSLGERGREDLIAWRKNGADRYLLRFETSDPELYSRIHPTLRIVGGPVPGGSDEVVPRIRMLRELRELGYEIGSGVMIGIPGQTYAMLTRDILMFRLLDLDMIGVGPYIAHPDTPLGQQLPATNGNGDGSADEEIESLTARSQVPNTEAMTYKVVALTRLACPEANIPSTTALATLNRRSGRELGLTRGANIVMPNVTPVRYRAMYEIYPAKACITETASACQNCLRARIRLIGRTVGAGAGGRRRSTKA